MSGFENVTGLQHENEGIMNDLSSGLRTNVSEMAISSMSVAKPSDGANPFRTSSDWDLIVSLSQVQTFGGSPMVSHSEFANSPCPLVLENQGMSSTSHLVQYISDSNVEDMAPKVPSYGSGSFLEMVGSFGQPGSDDVANTGHQPTYNLSNEEGIEKGPINNEQFQGQGSNPEEVDPGSAPSENRRKRVLECNYTLSPHKNAEGDALKDSFVKNSDGVKEQDEKKQKIEQSTSAHLLGKQSVKQNKDNSHEGEAPKENLVHVRAGRGRATNSHSLAERVRREKISERMRFLQELVPGCNKITGKAVMLDEIINYVQSLQQQVEFLSMKLATVKPELNFDVVEGILSKDILQSRITHIPIGGGYGPTPSINSSHPFPTGSLQGTLAGMPSTSTQFPTLPRTVLDHEFHSFYGMSFDSSTTNC